MGKIKKILENELVGGTQSTDVYPVTSVKAVYDENNERLDHILNRRGVVNVSTNYNDDHTAEVLTLAQAIAKVPSKDRVLGFQGKFLTESGWENYMFIGESIANWSDKSKWSKYYAKEEVDASQKEQDKIINEVAPPISKWFRNINSVVSTSVDDELPYEIGLMRKGSDLLYTDANNSYKTYTIDASGGDYVRGRRVIIAGLVNSFDTAIYSNIKIYKSEELLFDTYIFSFGYAELIIPQNYKVKISTYSKIGNGVFTTDSLLLCNNVVDIAEVKKYEGYYEMDGKVYRHKKGYYTTGIVPIEMLYPVFDITLKGCDYSTAALSLYDKDFNVLNVYNKVNGTINVSLSDLNLEKARYIQITQRSNTADYVKNLIVGLFISKTLGYFQKNEGYTWNALSEGNFIKREGYYLNLSATLSQMSNWCLWILPVSAGEIYHYQGFVKGDITCAALFEDKELSVLLKADMVATNTKETFISSDLKIEQDGYLAFCSPYSNFVWSICFSSTQSESLIDNVPRNIFNLLYNERKNTQPSINFLYEKSLKFGTWTGGECDTNKILNYKNQSVICNKISVSPSPVSSNKHRFGFGPFYGGDFNGEYVTVFLLLYSENELELDNWNVDVGGGGNSFTIIDISKKDLNIGWNEIKLTLRNNNNNNARATWICCDSSNLDGKEIYAAYFPFSKAIIGNWNNIPVIKYDDTRLAYLFKKKGIEKLGFKKGYLGSNGSVTGWKSNMGITFVSVEQIGSNVGYFSKNISVAPPNCVVSFYSAETVEECNSGTFVGCCCIGGLKTAVKGESFCIPGNAKILAIYGGYEYDNLNSLIYFESHNSEDFELPVEENNIPCFGDSLTAGGAGGAAGGSPYPVLLQNILGSKYNVINCGVGGETIQSIAARQGCSPMLNKNEFTLPSDTSEVVLGKKSEQPLINAFGTKILPLLQGQGNSLNPIYVDGIECTLTTTATPYADGDYKIKRNEAGIERRIIPNTPFATKGSMTYRNPYAAIYWVGTNGEWTTVDELIEWYDRFIEFGGTSNYIIIGLHTSNRKDNFEELEQKFSQKYGLHYINWRKYGVEYGLSDAGISPTPQDEEDISQGLFPTSLRVDGVHLTAKAYELLTNLIVQRMKYLGII